MNKSLSKPLIARTLTTDRRSARACAIIQDTKRFRVELPEPTKDKEDIAVALAASERYRLSRLNDQVEPEILEKASRTPFGDRIKPLGKKALNILLNPV